MMLLAVVVWEIAVSRVRFICMPHVVDTPSVKIWQFWYMVNYSQR